MHIILWVEIIDTMSGIVKPPSSMEFIKAARFTFSLPFQMKEQSNSLIFLAKSDFLHETKVTPLHDQLFKSSFKNFSID